ncbi:MAG: IPT/TIG domain-containing protein [Ginsengibacter sp.]
MKLTVWLFVIIIAAQVGCTKNDIPLKVKNVAIISISPSSGRAGTVVVIKGANFAADVSDNLMKFNNDSAMVLSASDDSLVVVAPLKGTSGPVTVTVEGITATGPVFTYINDSVDVYAAAPAFGVVYWKNGEEIFLEPTQNNTGGAYGLAVSGTDVYVGSYTFFSVFPGLTAAYWKNGQKVILSPTDVSGEVRSLILSNGDVYVGGSENQQPVYWKNGVKHVLPTTTPSYGRVNALAVDGTDVYAAGYEADNEGRSVYWKNGIETILGTLSVVDGGATSIAVSGTDVYVSSTDSGDAVYWKNGVRVTLAKFPFNNTADANAIAVWGNSVYVAGAYLGDAVYWKDATKIILPKRSFYAQATAITFYQSDIYIGGIDGNTPVYWKNGVEVALCCNESGSVSAIAVVKH